MNAIAATKSRLLSSEAVWPAYVRYWVLRGGCLVEPHLVRGEGRICQCCGGHFRCFQEFHSIPEARCPGCWSLARQRVLWLYLERETEVLQQPGRVLQFAPDWASYRRLSRLPGIEYVTADVRRSPLVKRQMDITAIPMADQSVDLVLVSHVLEHVPDDRAAMSEIRRVLKPSGRALLQHPIAKGQIETDEDPTVTDPHEREQRWGQADHVRMYGTDHYDRLRAAGLSVQVVAYHERFSPEDVRRYGLADDSTCRSQDIAVCSPAS
jgi:SAM-dependent methyltransferase